MATLAGNEEVGKPEFKTNLFRSLKNKKNKKPLRKLYKYSLLMVTLPIVSFFITRDYLASNLGLEKKYYDLVAGLAAILVTNIIIGKYIIDAFSEPVERPMEEGLNVVAKKKQ